MTDESKRAAWPCSQCGCVANDWHYPNCPSGLGLFNPAYVAPLNQEVRTVVFGGRLGGNNFTYCPHCGQKL